MTPHEPNRLLHEKSPYLLQHAYNPVDWYPWGSEAFEKAQKENKPIFLSVGYSTCHWCHVMERESFENQEIAAVLNRFFIPIKVDREERPDVDHVYMTFVQASTGSGGWPMSVFMTPDLKPFFGGTYYPPDSRYGRPGFKDILEQLGTMWKNNPQKMLTAASDVMQLLERANQPHGKTDGINEEPLKECFRYFQGSYDHQYGGFDGPPKFPRPSVFNLLLRFYNRYQRKEALDMTVQTLKKMARSGIYDHLGGGFHRYSVDAEWHVPHFEKMLYDQAQLVCSYVEAYQITRDDELARVARDTLEYVQRDMTHVDGGFFSAEDADSVVDPAHPEEKGEGAFYVWEAEELSAVLEPEQSLVVRNYYGVQPRGNVPHDPQDEFRNKNILHIQMDLDVLAHKTGKTVDEVLEILGQSRKRLVEERSKRIRPYLDDKVLTAWNGLMISAFARASEVLDDKTYLEVANRAADFIYGTLWEPKTRELRRRFRDGDVGVEGHLDDYAFFIQGFVDLYEASGDSRRLEQAVELQERQIELFWDDKNGGFFDTTGRDPSILIRGKEEYDGAEPAPNSIAILNLLRLGEMTDNEGWRTRARQSLELFAGRTAPAIPQMLVAVDFILTQPVQIVVAGHPGDDREALLKEVRRHFLPRRVLLRADADTPLERLLPQLKEMQPRGGKATAYVCENFTCKEPTTDPATLARLLGITPGP